MKADTVIGVDLGGTKVKAARVKGSAIEASKRQPVPSSGTEEEVLREIIRSIEDVWADGVAAIGIGVPSIVDVDKGIVYDVQNIPSWKKVPLKRILEKQFGVPVYVNNDANCFALGEKHFGKGQPYAHMVGLIIGTGMAGGILAGHRLYNGHNCGAGEFGMLPYLGHNYEYYCSGQFFFNVHRARGEVLFEQARNGDALALSIFSEYGKHLGNGIIAILYALDPEAIILGGSVSRAYPFFKEALWKQLENFAYSPVVNRLAIEVSEDPNIPVLGAAGLFYNAVSKKQKR